MPPKPNTVELKAFLKTRMRKYVGHPSIPGEKVRVESVTREQWSMRFNDRFYDVKFRGMTTDQVDNVMGRGAA